MPQERADPRVLRSKATIMDACAELIAEEGFSGVSIEAVAARSGAAKTTIYRHWPSREALCIEAFIACKAADGRALPDSGELREDLITVMWGLADRLNDPAWTASLTSLVDAASRDPELAELHRVTVADGRRTLCDVLARALERGDLEAPLDIELATAHFAGPIFYRGIIAREPMDEDFVASVVDGALAALRAQAARGAAS